MEVRTCTECGNYKYIKSDGLCRECQDDTEKWKVVAIYGQLKRTYVDDLTESEAKQMVNEKSKFLRAVPMNS